MRAGSGTDVVKAVFLKEVASRDDDEVGPIATAEQCKDEEEFRCARRCHLRQWQAELADVRSLLFGGSASLHLDAQDAREILRYQQVVANVNFGSGHLPAAHEKVRDHGVLAGSSSEEVTAGH